MNEELENTLQTVSDYLSCPIACAKNLRYNGFYFHAFTKGIPMNLVEFASKGKFSTLTEDGYNACIEKDENNNEVYHRVDECDNVFILPIKSDGFVDKIIEPRTGSITE